MAVLDMILEGDSEARAVPELAGVIREANDWWEGGRFLVVPFHMINVAAGIMAVRLGPYTIATVIGLLPAHTIYCWIGARLNTLLAQDPNPDFQALFSQFWDFTQGESWSERWVLAPLDAVIFILAVWLIVEAVGALRRGSRREYDESGSPLGDDRDVTRR